MSDILSQDEVDALLKGVEGGDIEVEQSQEFDTSGIKKYDFVSQERVVRGRMPGLEMINEMFASYFRNSVSAFIMRFADVGIQSVDITKFGDFLKSIPFPSSINILKKEPLKGYSLFVIEAPLVFAFVEYFFGASSAKYVKSEGRAFTSIEQRIIKKIVDIALNDIALAWKGIVEINPTCISSEMNPRFITIVPQNEIVIKIEMHVEIEDFTGKMFFCIPYPLIEPLKEKLYSGIEAVKQETDHRWTSRLKESLMDSSVEINVELGNVDMTIRELMDLKIGSIINIGKAITDDLVVKVEGIEKMYGTPGYSRGSQAIKITRII